MLSRSVPRMSILGMCNEMSESLGSWKVGKTMMRNVLILKNQVKELSLRQFATLIKRALFFSAPILVYEKDLSRQNSLIFKVLEGVTINKGTLNDLEYAKQALKPLPWEFQCHEFDGVKDFFVAKDAGGIQHISWIYYREHHNRLLSLGAREAEIKFCLTLPARRGQGVYPRVLCSVLAYLESTGMQRAFICAHRENIPSIRGIEKAGFVRLGEIRLRKVLGFQVSPKLDTLRRVP